MEEFVFASVVETGGIISQIGGRVLRLPHSDSCLHLLLFVGIISQMG
jgi:hypothetical protein